MHRGEVAPLPRKLLFPYIHLPPPPPQNLPLPPGASASIPHPPVAPPPDSCYPHEHLRPWTKPAAPPTPAPVEPLSIQARPAPSQLRQTAPNKTCHYTPLTATFQGAAPTPKGCTPTSHMPVPPPRRVRRGHPTSAPPTRRSPPSPQQAVGPLPHKPSFPSSPHQPPSPPTICVPPLQLPPLLHEAPSPCSQPPPPLASHRPVPPAADPPWPSLPRPPPPPPREQR